MLGALKAAVLNPVAASAYDADVLAYVATFGADPGATYKGLLSTLVTDLKADGIWAKLDWFSDLEAPEQTPSLVNIKSLAQTLATVGSVGTQIVYTANLGWAGDGSAGYLTFGVTFDSLTNFTSNSASAGAWCNDQGAGSGNKPHVSDLAASFHRILVNAANTGVAESFRGNDSTSTTVATSASRLGHRTVTVDGANSKNYYKAGASLATATARSSAGVSAGNGALLCQNGTTFCADRLAIAYVGGTLTAGEVATMHTRLNTFLTARGSN
jgi:hypothetical protein